MNRILLAMAVLLLASFTASADEVKLDSRIDSVGLFKNGLAVVHRSIEINGPGVYCIEDVPAPVHGTFWIDSDLPVDAQVTMRDVTLPVNVNAGVNYQQDLAGRQVTIHFRDAGIPAVAGKVLDIVRSRDNQAWSRAYQQSRSWDVSLGQLQNNHENVLILETDQGCVYLDPSLIAFVQADGRGDMVKRRQAVLLLTVGGEKKAATIHISYLAKGLGWAPSYRVSLLDDKNLSIEQQAVVKNELQDLKETEVSLISGFPSVEFSNVLSPISLNQNWAQFFAQISQNPAQMGNMAGNSIMAQNTAGNFNFNSDEGIDMSAIPAGEGVDLHYQSIGNRTMAEGDALAVSVAKAQASYERLVEWVVPDARDADGRFAGGYYRRSEPATDGDSVWDAVRFKNPLPFAMTTAPAMVLDGGHFAGMRMSYWVNSGEQTTLQITKALSIRTRATEQEDQSGKRDMVVSGGRNFYRVLVNGELTISNHRNQDINMVIRRQFSGDLVKADADPKLVLREEGVDSINRRNELTWTLSIKSGEQKTLTYQYSVLVAQ